MALIDGTTRNSSTRKIAGSRRWKTNAQRAAILLWGNTLPVCWVTGVDGAVVSIVAHDGCVLTSRLGITAIGCAQETVVAIDRFGDCQAPVLLAIAVVILGACVPVVTERVAGRGAIPGKVTVGKMG